MLRTKVDVDRHVAKALAKLRTDREKSFRGYTIGRLYFDIGDYETCVRYVTQYLTVKDNNAAAHNLLGQAYNKLGRKEEAFSEFKTSLELDPSQNNLILKVCELLSEETINADAGCVRYWVDRAGTNFSRHPTIFRLCQRLLEMEHADSSSLTTLLRDQVAARPLDPPSHARLLRHLVQSKQSRDAFNHAYDTQLSNPDAFNNSYLWLDAVIEVVDAFKSEALEATNIIVWNYWLLCLTVLERKVYLQLGWSKSPSDAVDALRKFDNALIDASNCRKLETPDVLLKHFSGQLCLHSGSAILKKAIHEQNGWREATRLAAPWFLLAFQTESSATQNKDLSSFWPSSIAHRKSQSGHTLLVCSKDKKQQFLDNISVYFSDKCWRDKIYRDLFGNKENSKASLSYILCPKSFFEPKLKLPSVGIELQQADLLSRSFQSSSLHLQTWIGLNFEKLSKISSLDTIELPSYIDNLRNCGPETLCKFDIDAFLYCTILIAQKTLESSVKPDFCKLDRPSLMPAILMEPLCNAEQAKWWECAERIAKRDIGSQSNDLRSVLIRGIETVRCVGNHGIDPYILAMLGRIFAQRSEVNTNQKNALMKRAALYYETALPLLEQLKDRLTRNPPKKRIFNFTSRDISADRTNAMIEETKLFMGTYFMDENDNEKAIEILTGVKSPYASFNLFKIHMKLADEQVNLKKESVTSEMRTKRFALLSKARKFIYITSDQLKDLHVDSRHPLSGILSESIADVEKLLSSVDLDNNVSKNMSDGNDYSSDQQSSVEEHDRIDSTPMKYQRAPHISSTSSSIKAQLQDLKKKEFLSDSVMKQISALLDSNKLLTEEVHNFKSALNDMKIQHLDSADKRKFLISVDDIKTKVDELHEEYVINTIDLKKELGDLRKELEKLKISSNTQQRQDSNELLLEETLKNNSAALHNFLPRGPIGNPALPAHPLYTPNLYPFYTGQYPAVPQMFPPQLFPPDQPLYSDLLVAPQVPPPQPVQSAIHDYHISLPVQAQPVAPSLLSSLTTSTPAKPMFDASRFNNVPSKPFNLFDQSKSNNGIVDPTKPQPTIGTAVPFTFTKDRPETGTLNKSRTLSEKSNESYDPLPDYRPMVPLPDEIVPTTGEEGEEIIFDARAKLFRFIAAEWKERGLGQLKLLKNENTGKIRLLMRRDTVHTVCANHIITPEMELSPMKGTDKAYFWVANDFADETVKLEKFCIRFKTVEIGKKFFDMFNNCKNQAITEVNERKSSTAAAQKKDSLNNAVKKEEQPKAPVANSVGGFTFTTPPVIKDVKDTPPVTPVATTTSSTIPNPFASFSFIKPPTFLVTATSTATSVITTQTSAPLLSQTNVTTTQAEPEAKVAVSGWGDKFKPKAGSWNCTACYINNEGANDYCIACNSPKDPSMPKKEDKAPEFDGPKFTFGIPSGTPVAPVNAAEAPNPSTFKFGFDIATSQSGTFSFGSPQVVKSPTNKPNNQPIILGAMENTKYDFAFTPKSTPKSPNKSFNESFTEDNDNSQEDEGHHIFFEPVIPMPDKVDVKTGEEDENVLYVHRAKLYRFADSEWKECGVGDIKILQHNINKKLRVLMRREPILKICLNHYLTADTEYMPKDEKSWLFSACDFSTGEICPQQFCIRFTNKIVANEFKDAAENAKKLITDEVPADSTTKEDIQFISESNVTDNEVEQARELMLPDKYYSYKHLPECPGCRGCDSDKESCKIHDSTSESVTENVTQSPNNLAPNDPEKPTGFTFGFNVPKTSAEVANPNPFSNSTKHLFGTIPMPTTGFGSGAMLFGSQTNSPFIGTPASNKPQLPFNGSSMFGTNTNTNYNKSAPTLLEALLKDKPNSNNASVTNVTFTTIDNSAAVKTAPVTTAPFGGFTGIFGSSGSFSTPTTIEDAAKNSEKNWSFTPKFQTPGVNKIQPEGGNQFSITPNPLLNKPNESTDLNKDNKESTDNDVEFVSESEVTEEELLKARKLMLPDKFYAYKNLPACSGCRGCSSEDGEHLNAIPTDLTKPKHSAPKTSTEAKVSTGSFNFNQFTIPKTTSVTIFGGNSNLSTVTPPTIFPTNASQPVFGVSATPVFGGGGMIFGARAQQPFNAVGVNVAYSSLIENKGVPFDSILKNNTQNIFGSGLTITEITDKTPQPPSATPVTSSIFSGFNACSPSIFSNSNPNFSMSFTPNKPSFSFGKPAVDTKVTDLNTSYRSGSDEEEPEEGQDIFFKPLIPLPDEVEVKTGEEDEEILYSHRSKLYRFAESEWKECGVGDIKILRHPQNNKLRVLMRREPILKVCLNHALTTDVEYIAKDEKSWLFSVCDYSTGEITPQQFCIRFANKIIAEDFHKVINDVKSKYLNDPSEDNSNTSLQANVTIVEETKEVKTVAAADSSQTTPDSASDKKTTKPLVTAPKFIAPATFSAPDVSQNSQISETVIKTAPVFGAPKHMPTTNTMFSSGLTFGNNATPLSFENILKEGDQQNIPDKWLASEDFCTLASKHKPEENKITANNMNNIKPFVWEGAGTPLFSSSAAKTPSKTEDGDEENPEDHDPQFKPIVPLPDKIEIVTGEEDEAIEFNSRGKLYRWSNAEWRERGTGEFKILHHPERGSYRMLLRQEQVHKVVLNQLITSDLELMAMPNSPKAFMWCGLNYTDDEQGAMEKLAVRFRSEELANKFKTKMDSIISALPLITSSDEIIVTGVPEEFINARYQEHDEDYVDSDEENCDEEEYDSSTNH